ncbi:MAG: dihydropteroate synthase [Planctomycetaceae bacterium]|nr:dihydropteroate synthase [Planctomycetaceae bacterium]
MTERVLFVTGRLAEHSLRKVLGRLDDSLGIEPEVCVLGISVAALMHANWVLRKLDVPSDIERVVLPGWCQGDIDSLTERYGCPVELGPKDLFDLPEFLGGKQRESIDLSAYDIDILAEINHAPNLSDDDIIDMAASFRDSGADVIDVGCIPGQTWNRVGEVVDLLRKEGHRISIDSFERREVEAAVSHGAELVLSCNSSNVEWLGKLGVEVVVIPDEIRDPSTMQTTIDALLASGTPFRVDPIIEPIGFGFAASLARYFEVRKWLPDVEIMMGIGNLTELTEVDSAGVNFLLAGICQELNVHSVLTTEVINWCQSSVAEFDVARRLTKYSVDHKTLPKHIDSRLVMLRDNKLRELGDELLSVIASDVKDANFRIFAEAEEIYLINRYGYWRGSDPYEVFDRAVAECQASGAAELEPAHAFYLGYELAKARTALTLGKNYIQDEALDWGFLTTEEVSAIERRRHAE